MAPGRLIFKILKYAVEAAPQNGRFHDTSHLLEEPNFTLYYMGYG